MLFVQEGVEIRSTLVSSVPFCLGCLTGSTLLASCVDEVEGDILGWGFH